jgi:malonyl-CoA O-methyltransferase
MNALQHLEQHKVIQSFDRVAQTYEQWAKLQKIVGENLLERLDWLKINPHQILEVGAGTARLSRHLTQRYPQAKIYSIDISTKMLQVAQTRVAQKPSQPYFICANASQLPLADNSIDLLMSNLMLQWCNDINLVFAEFARVLKSDGTLFFSTFGPDTLIELRQSWAQVDNASHVNYFVDMHDLGDALLHAGLIDPVMDVDRFQLTYADIRKVMRELKQIGAQNITAGRPHGLMGKTKFNAMLAAYEQYRTKEGLLPVTYEVVYGHAWGPKNQKSLPTSSHTVTIPISQIKKAN